MSEIADIMRRDRCSWSEAKAKADAELPPVRVEADVGLLPCPFCGGRAEMNHGGFGECFVTCADDNCGGRLGTGIWFTTAAQAMDVWNRRPNAPAEARRKEKQLTP